MKLVKEFENFIDLILPYTSFAAKKAKQLEDENKKASFFKLQEKYAHFIKYFMNMKTGNKPELPTVIDVPKLDSEGCDKFKLNSLREYIACLRLYEKRGTQEFNKLFE
ncbi:MAG: hypothetical protein NWE84_06305 [Candidatus Bathyarchaeota archaeon]|nr:hypothetical protein [Candidatus Bathyarchaeota archaeon]